MKLSKPQKLFVRPSQDVDVRDKVSEWWLVENAKYFRQRFLDDKSTISQSDHDRFEINYSYADGSQDTTQYQPILRGVGNDEDGWLNINWKNVYNPMPKNMRKIIGMFLSEDHSIVASAVSEKARTDKLKNVFKKQLDARSKPKLDAVKKAMGSEDLDVSGDEGFIADTEDEATMISKFSSEKLNYELAAEKVVDYTMKLSEYSKNKERSVRDLVCNNLMINKDIVDDYTGKVKWEFVAANSFAGDFDTDTESMSWGGDFRYFTISEIRKYRPDIKEEELAKIARDNKDSNISNGFTFDSYNKYYSNSKAYGYDEFNILVFMVSFKSVDSKYKKKVKIPSGEFRSFDADFGKKGKNISVETEEAIYEVAWIVGTENMLWGGKMTDIPRNSSGKVRMPYHVVRLDGKSIVELVKGILDQLALLRYKLENAWAKAVPNSYSYDFAALEDISDASGGKIDPFDLITMFQQGNGMPYRSIPLDNDDLSIRRNPPILPSTGGIGGFLNELIVTKEMLIKDLAELTGISPFEVPQGGSATATEAKLAVASMSDVLKPLYSSYIRVKEELAFNTIVRAQILFKYNTKATKAYEDAIGKNHVASLKAAMSTDPMDIGVKFEALPTSEQKQAVLGAAQAALKVGRDGRSILKMSEYLFIFRNINTQSGLKEAEMLITLREKEEEKRSYIASQAAMESQGQYQMQQAKMKIDGEVAKKQAQGQIDGGLSQQQMKLNVEEYSQKKRIDAGVNLFDKGVDIGVQQQQTQE